MFGAMTLCGYHAVKILQTGAAERKKLAHLAALAVSLLAVGLVSSRWIPVIKPVYTLSFTALAMGWSTLALAALYALADILRFRRGFAVFVLLGRNSLFAYMTGSFGAVFAAGAARLLGGLAIWVGPTVMPVLLALGGSSLQLGSVWFWDRFKRVRT
jgi:predicted acyltransferase